MAMCRYVTSSSEAKYSDAKTVSERNLAQTRWAVGVVVQQHHGFTDGPSAGSDPHVW